MAARRLPEVAFGCATLALGVAVTVAARTIPTGFGYDTAGPRLLPFIIGGGLILSALLVLAGTLASRPDMPKHDEEGVAWMPVVLLSAVLLLEAALIDTLGWIPLGTLVFATGAWTFGDRRLALNLMIGLLLCVAIELLFTFALGIDLPLGILAPLLPWLA